MNKLSDYDVHFAITGFYKIRASSQKEAESIVNKIINSKIDSVESLLCTGIKDDNYVTEII